MTDKKKTVLLNLVRVICIAAACGLIAFGVSRGEVPVVLGKAVKICLECIGIG